jgi:hypothetical protein
MFFGSSEDGLPESAPGYSLQERDVRATSAFPLIATEERTPRDVSNVPLGDLAGLALVVPTDLAKLPMGRIMRATRAGWLLTGNIISILIINILIILLREFHARAPRWIKGKVTTGAVVAQSARASGSPLSPNLPWRDG